MVLYFFRWSFSFFFYNRKLKRVVSFHFSCLRWLLSFFIVLFFLKWNMENAIQTESWCRMMWFHFLTMTLTPINLCPNSKSDTAHAVLIEVFWSVFVVYHSRFGFMILILSAAAIWWLRVFLWRRDHGPRKDKYSTTWTYKSRLSVRC